MFDVLIVPTWFFTMIFSSSIELYKSLIVFSKKATTRLSGSQFLAAVSQTKLSTTMNVDNLQMKITIKKKADQTLAQIILEMQNLLSEIAKMLSSQEKVHEG